MTRPRTTPTGTRASGTTPSSGTPAAGCLVSARQRSLWAVRASAFETWRLRTRWRQDSSGRADPFALSGDLVGSADAPIEEEGVACDSVLEAEVPRDLRDGAP